MPMPDLVTIVNQKLSALNIPASTLAALSDISGGVLSTYLNGVKTAPSDHALRIYRVATDLEQLVNTCAPVPVDFRQVSVLRDCLTSIKDGRLKILVQQNEPSTQERAFVIQFANGNFFSHQDRDGQVLQTINFLQGAMVSENVASELTNIFKGMGFRCKAVENKYGDSSPAFELSQIWHEESGSAVQTGSEVSA
jgi:hypothetical protein